ncbi:Telomere-associated protein RIF1 [Zootermopsis nevadensis]|uniref:Telomere-associated protein RIF1 n=1 Tax=Zootermopsis nevadensis TaxID=136037 RepID=A0A067QW54_ZOONE|nr:Telomere-associated protein RIF1 [Zootermopsis nevadensis]
MWKCYFTFIETYLPQKSVKDFLGWMSALLEAGFRHPVEEIRHVTTKFWDNVVIPAFAKDNTNVPQVLKEARKNYSGKSGQIPNIFCIVSDDVSDTFSQLDAKGKPLDSVPDAIFVLPEETEKPSKRRQSLLRQLRDEGRILTKHQKEVFRRRKDDIPALYNSTIQPVQEDSLISESSQDTSDFAAPQRVIEPLRNDAIALEAKELLIASSLKVLEPPSSLQRLAEYRKKMMIDHEGSIVLASISGNNSPVSADIPKQPVLSHEILDTQVQAESEPPNSPLSLTLLSDHCEPTTLPSNGRKLNLEFVAVRLPTSILVPSKDTPELAESELVHEQDISVNPEVAIRVSISTPAPTSVASGGIDAPVSFPLEEPAVCQDVIMRSSKQGHPDSHNILASPVELQEILELPTASLAVLTDKNMSPRASDITNIVPGSSNPLLIEASNKNKTGCVQKVDHSTKSSTRKPVVVNTDNPLTNYFKPVSITLTADDDEVDSRKGSARTIHLSLETLDNNVTTSVIAEPCLHNPETPYESQQILPKLAEVVEDSHVTSVSIVEASVGTQSSDVECEVSDWRKTLSPVKVVVEKVEDFILTKTFSALETTPPLNIEHDKELPLNEVSSSSRRKIKSPLKRNPGDPKLPPFKGKSKIAQQMETKVQHKEAIPEARLSKSGSKYVKRKDGKKPKALKRSSRSRSASKRGTDDNVTKVTVEEAITGPETASVDNPSPSLLPVASGRSQSVVKKTRSRKTHNKVNENVVAMPQNREISSLPTIESQQKLKILKSVEANKCNSKSRESSSIKDLNDSSQVMTSSNESSLAHDKKQAFNVEIDRQNSHRPSKARVRKVAGCNCNSVSNEAVDVKVITEPMKPCAKLEEKVIKENFSGSKVPSKLTNRESLKSKTEAPVKDVKFTKQNISESDDTLSKKVLATDTEICEPSVVNNIETFQKVHNEMLTDNIKPCDPNPFNTDELLAIGIKNETLPCLETFEPESSGLGIENENVLCLETSTETRTSKEDPYNLRKGGQDDVDEIASESNDSHKHSGCVADDVRSGKRSVKSVFPKVKVVNYTPVLETSVLQPKEEIIISSNDTNLKPSARFGNFTSKLKSAVTLLGSSGKEIDQDKPADVAGETACSLKMGGALSLLTSGTETFELHNTEVEHEEENSERTQHNHSLIHIEHVSSERRKRKFDETGLKDDLNAVQMSIKRSASSHHQSALRTSIIEEDLVPLLRKDVKSSLSKNPEMLVASPVTAAAGEITVLGVTGTAALLTSTEASAVTSPMLTDVLPAVCSSEEGILPAKSQILPELIKSLSDKSIEKGMSVQSFENEDFSISVNASTDGFHKEKVTSHEKMVTRQRSRCSAFNVKTPCDIQSSRELCSSATRLDEDIKTVVGYDTAGSGLKHTSSSQKPMKVTVPYLNTRESMNSKFEASECSEELDVQTSKTVSNVVTLSQKEIFTESSMSKLDLKTSLRCEETSFSESEVTLPCFETENTSTGSQEVQTEFQKVADSEDVIESSQDLSASSLIASRFPLMHKCSVSVCRIDTTLDPGVEVNISQGDQKLVVLMPEHCNSPFKVYTPGSKTPTGMQEEKSATAKSEMEETYRLKLLPATRTLYGNSSDINQMDSVQDKPSIPLGSNSSVGDSMKESANKVSVDSVSTSGDDTPKPRSEKETITSKCEGNISSVAKTDTTESKGSVPVVTADYVSESRSNEQIRVSDVVMNVGPRKHRPRRYNTLKSEGGVPLVVDDTSYLRFKHQSKSESDESIALVTENYTSKSASKQQFDKPTTANSVLMTLKCDTLKLRTREQTNMLRPEDNISPVMVSENGISTAAEEGAPEHRCLQQINRLEFQDNVSAIEKEDTLKHQFEQQQQINVTLSDVNVPVVGNEDTPKPQTMEHINTSELQDNVSSSGKEDILTPQSEEWINTLSEVNISIVSTGYTPKRRSKQQIDTSKSGDDVSVVCKEDTPKRRSKQQIDTSKSSDDVSVVCKEDTPKRRSKQQIDTSKSSDDVSVVCKEDTPKLRSKQQITYESVSTVGKEDKPTLRSKRLTSTSKSEKYILKAGKECIQKPQCRKQVNTLVTNSNVLILKNEETPKLRTRQQCNRSKSVDKVSRTSKRDSLKPISKKQINMSSTVNVPPSMNEDSDKRQSKKHVNTSKSDVCEGDGLKSQSKQQIDTSVVESNALMVDSEGNPKLQSRQPVSENNVITGSSEGNPKQESKRQINTSEFGKEDTSKPRLKQQIINTSEFECNVSRVGEKDFPKPQSKHEVNVSSVVNEDSTEPHSKQQINISDSEGIISSVRKEDILKYQFKTQIDVSVLKNDVSAVRSEDTQKLESRQQINTSDSADNISVVGRGDPPVPQSDHQINASVSECNEEVRRLRSKHRLSTPISEACVSTKRKYGSIKPHPKQEINSSASEDGVFQQQINILKCQDNVFTDVKGVLKPPSKQQIETSESETFISTTTEEDTSLSKSKQRIDMSESEITPLIAASKSTFKHRVSGLKSNSTIVTDLTKQSKQSENENVSVMRDDAPKPILKQELGSSNVDESIKICPVDDTTELSSKCSGTKRKVDQDSEVVSDAEIQGSKIIFSYSEKVLGEAELVEDEARRLVTPKSVTIDHCKDKGNKKIKEDIISKLDHKTSGADDILKAFAQEKTSDDHFIDISDINKALESNDTNISAVDSKLASPLRPRKRSASSSRVALEVSLGQVDSNINDHVDTGISKTKRLSHNAENVNEESVCDRSPVGTPSQCNNTLSDNDKALLPSSPKSLLSSPRSLLRAFSSPLGSLESNQTQKNHRKRSTGGRAQYMVGLAVAVNDVGTSQASSPVVPQKSEEIRSIAATPPLSSRKLPCGVSDAGTESSLTPLERLQCSVSECETPSPSCVSSLAEIPYKRVLKQSGEQGTPPSKKKRVWFPDPEVSGTRLFSTHDAVDSACTSMSKRRSPHSPTRMLLGRRRKARTQCAAVSIDTGIHDKSSDPALSTATTPYAEETSPQSQSSPDLTGVTSQGSVEETATELLNSQDAFFPALINCNHPIECVAPRLTTHVMWTKALVVELTRKNIHTIGDLSRLDEASINRLPIANPKISHAKTILQDYVKSLEVESDRSPSIISKGGVSRSEDAHLEPESVLSSPSPSVSTADVVKFFVTNEGSLATVLEEASKRQWHWNVHFACFTTSLQIT